MERTDERRSDRRGVTAVAFPGEDGSVIGIPGRVLGMAVRWDEPAEDNTVIARHAFPHEPITGTIEFDSVSWDILEQMIRDTPGPTFTLTASAWTHTLPAWQQARKARLYREFRDAQRLLSLGIMTPNYRGHPNYRRAARGTVQQSRKQRAAEYRQRLGSGHA